MSLKMGKADRLSSHYVPVLLGQHSGPTILVLWTALCGGLASLMRQWCPIPDEAPTKNPSLQRLGFSAFTKLTKRHHHGSYAI